MTGSAFPPPTPRSPFPPPPPRRPEAPVPGTASDQPSASWWTRTAWILPIWAWILVGLFGVGAVSGALGESNDEAGDTGAAVTTDISVGTEAAVTTTAATTEATTATTTTIPEPDDSADVLRWSAYATEASEVSSGVILQVGGIATDAGADTRGWVAGDYANEAIDAWIEASLMLEEWKERPQPVPERAGQCDALATQMFETTLDIADVFSDMAIEGSTDLDLLEQVSADIGSIGDLAEENKACVDRL